MMNISNKDYIHHQKKKLKRIITPKYQSSTLFENHTSSSNKCNRNTTSNNSIDDIPSLVAQSPKQVNMNEAKNNNVLPDEPNNSGLHKPPKKRI